MVPLSMVVRDELGQRSSQVALTKWNHPVETFLFDRPYEAFGIGIGVWRLKRGLNDPDPGIIQEPPNGPAPLAVSVPDQPPMTNQHAFINRGERATDLTHEHLVGMRRTAHDRHTP